MTPCLRLITYTGVSHHLNYLSSAFHTLFPKSCFATADIAERLPLCVCLLTTWILIWPFAACLIDPACLVDLLYSLSAAWPTFCIDSVYESALPTLLLILLIELCLSDFCFVLIKLHMDPNVTDPSLQTQFFLFLGWTVHLRFGQNNNIKIFDYIFKII